MDDFRALVCRGLLAVFAIYPSITSLSIVLWVSCVTYGNRLAIMAYLCNAHGGRPDSRGITQQFLGRVKRIEMS